jgi:sulfite exporter TauE/SafE
MYNSPSFINKLSGNILQDKKWNKNSFIHGVLNGLLPCGLVYMALTAAITTFSIDNAIYYMLLFGLGTIPALLLLLLFGKKLSKYIRFNYKLIIPFFFMISGILTLIKAFNLTIPASLDFWNSTLNPIMCH